VIEPEAVMCDLRKSIVTREADTEFQSLLGKLVKVSKAELDAEERKYQAMRKRLKDKQARKGKSGR
jgi:hypothetical protein